MERKPLIVTGVAVAAVAFRQQPTLYTWER
jgi:hypothetical protein